MCVVLRVLVQGICSYLGGNATAEETEVAKKNLDSIDQELGASNHGLLNDQEVHRLEDDLAVVYYQLGTAVRKLSVDLTHAFVLNRHSFLSFGGNICLVSPNLHNSSFFNHFSSCNNFVSIKSV